MEDEQDAWLFRIGSAAAVVGSLVGMVGNLIHPVTPENDPEGVARIIADSWLWVPDHLAIIVALLLMLGGLVAIGRSIKGGLAGALASFGTIAATIGLTAGIVLIALDGLAAKHLAEAWVAAPAAEKAIALRLTLGMETINFALLALFNIVFAGVTFILLGLATAWSRLYPSWVGWIAVVAGVGSVAVGLIQATTGESSVVTRVCAIIFPTVITLWTAAVGILLYRSVHTPTDTKQ